MKIKIIIGLTLLSVGILGISQTPNLISLDSSSSLIHTNKTTEQEQLKNIKTLQGTLHSNQNSPSQLQKIEHISPIDRIRAIKNKTQLHSSVLNDHNQFTRYPEDNRRINSSKQDPVMQRYQVDERATFNKDKTKSLIISADKKFYFHDEIVTINATIYDNEGKIVNAQLNGQLLNDQREIIKALEFSLLSNGNMQSQLDLSEFPHTSLPAGIYKIIINNAQYQITDALTFTLTQPDIELTGEYKEHIDDQGHLIFDVQVLASSNSQYYLQASLYSETEVPIGASQTSLSLTPGLHWVSLRYSGLMIQDAKESGPYVLKNVSIAKVTIPMMRAPLIQPNFTTESYALDEF